MSGSSSEAIGSLASKVVDYLYVSDTGADEYSPITSSSSSSYSGSSDSQRNCINDVKRENQYLKNRVQNILRENQYLRNRNENLTREVEILRQHCITTKSLSNDSSKSIGISSSSGTDFSYKSLLCSSPLSSAVGTPSALRPTQPKNPFACSSQWNVLDSPKKTYLGAGSENTATSLNPFSPPKCGTENMNRVTSYMAGSASTALPSTAVHLTSKSKFIGSYQEKADESDFTGYPTPTVHVPIRSQTEPIDYRRLLEKNFVCDWKLIVDRIVIDVDQQASIFLQQKLKKTANSCSPHKDAIIAEIAKQAYALTINRFGNFLVQKCLEYGTPHQVKEITKVLIGNVQTLAMNPFGCHVIQKTLDHGQDTIKTIIIEEMLKDIKQGMTDKYACHVWQKMIELRWNSSGNIGQFMSRVNLALKDQWVGIALTESGSLVIQNIFENCSDQEKGPCIQEIMAEFDVVIRGKWGTWIIQHMVENASEPCRQRVIKRVIDNAPVYSVDEHASKAVEKMVKMGDDNIVQAFLDKVSVNPVDGQRLPLVDNNHGNYLLQHILQNGQQSQKEMVANLLKPHMVTLRGSKWGTKCAWLIDKNKSKTSSSTRQPRI